MEQPNRLIRFIEKYEITPGNILLVCITMWLTAIAVRGVIFWFVYHGAIPAVFIKGYHIHHFITGFLMLIAAIALLRKDFFSRYIPLTLIGCSLGLIFDEFLFWARGHFNYWSAVNLFAVIIIGFIMISFYLYAKKQDLGRLSKKRIIATLLPILIFSAILYTLFHYQNLLAPTYSNQNLVQQEYQH